MEWELFIIPATMILVELLKRAPVPAKWLPHAACLVGLLLGATYALVYGGDPFALAFSGLVFGAAAAGIWDLGKSTVAAIQDRQTTDTE